MAKDRLTPPLIKPDERFSRIRLSEGHSLTSLLRYGRTHAARVGSGYRP